MKVLGLIPARGGSKRIPGKNLVNLDGQPLINWTIFSARECPDISDVVVSTDSEEIRSISIYAGAKVIMRPPEFASDAAGDFDVVRNALAQLGEPYDLIAYLRPTTPFRSQNTLSHAIKTMIAAAGVASGLRSIHEMGESAYKCFTLQPGPFLSEIGPGMSDLPNDQCPRTYHPNGYIDIMLPSEIMAGRLWSKNVIGLITKFTIEIDTPQDLEYARWYAASKYSREEVRFIDR